MVFKSVGHSGTQSNTDWRLFTALKTFYCCKRNKSSLWKLPSIVAMCFLSCQLLCHILLTYLFLKCIHFFRDKCQNNLLYAFMLIMLFVHKCWSFESPVTKRKNILFWLQQCLFKVVYKMQWNALCILQCVLVVEQLSKLHTQLVKSWIKCLTIIAADVHFCCCLHACLLL